jgi:hypothetical protein
MALNEYQALKIATKSDFYNQIIAMADRMVRDFKAVEVSNEVLQEFDSATLDGLGVPATEKTLAGNFRTMLDEVEQLRAGNAVTPATAWDDVLSELHQMRPF